MKHLYDFGSLPFQVGHQPSPENHELPDTLPFAIGVDQKTDRLIQLPNPVVEKALEKAYEKGSQIGVPLNDSGLGRECCDEFLDRILTSVEKSTLEGIRVLEIGSGNGYLLKRINDLGAITTGFEPGRTSNLYPELDIRPEPFTQNATKPDYDIIIHYCVLEHVSDPVAFLKAQVQSLKPGGVIIFAVPDCSTYIENGDISMFVHEHWSYFTLTSLRHVIQQAGLRIHPIKQSQLAGVLYIAAGPANMIETPPDAVDEANQFVQLMQRNLRQLQRYAERLSTEHTMGIFCPARFLNYQQLIDLPDSRIRYFDDYPELHGRYFPPYPIPIESREDLLKAPTDHLLIMSWTYGDKISASLSKALCGSNCQKIVRVKELFNA